MRIVKIVLASSIGFLYKSIMAAVVQRLEELIAQGGEWVCAQSTQLKGERLHPMRIQGTKTLQLTIAIAFSALCARADTIYVWSTNGTIMMLQDGVSSTFPTNLPGWNGPVGLAVDKPGRLHAACPAESYIHRFATNGSAPVVGYIDSISGLMFDGADNLYATYPNYNEIGRLSHVDNGGYEYWQPQSSNWTQSHLSFPISLAMDSVGNLCVANGDCSVPPYPPSGPRTNTLEVFSGDFTYVRTLATNLHGIWGPAFDQAGNLFASCSGDTNIVRFTPTGASSVFADASSGLSTPRGLAFDSAGNLYVANAGNGTIEKFTPQGVGSVVASNLVSPTSIALYPGLRLAMTPIVLTNPAILVGGAFRFTFLNTPGATFTALATTSAPSSTSAWTAVDGILETSPGFFQFTDAQATNFTRRFYRVRSP